MRCGCHSQNLAKGRYHVLWQQRQRFLGGVLKAMNSRQRSPFGKLFVHELKQVDYEQHPAVRTLWSYLRGTVERAVEGKLQQPTRHPPYKLAAAIRTSGLKSKEMERLPARAIQLLEGNLEDWTLTEVAVHVMTCDTCARRVFWLSQLERLTTPVQRLYCFFESLFSSSRVVFYAHLVGYATAGILIGISLQTNQPVALESGAGTVAGTILFKVLLGLASGWGTWGAVGLVSHWIKVFRKGR